MDRFRWNKVSEKFRIWDHDSDSEKGVSRSDKALIKKPDLTKFEDVLKALCRVVSELVEIEERKL